MEKIIDIYDMYASAAIDGLTEKEYLMNSLDWDINETDHKYTLRIRGADHRPMVAVGLITFRQKDTMIILINAVTGEHTQFQMKLNNDKNNLDEFVEFMLTYAQKLQEEAAYK